MKIVRTNLAGHIDNAILNVPPNKMQIMVNALLAYRVQIRKAMADNDDNTISFDRMLAKDYESAELNKFRLLQDEIDSMLNEFNNRKDVSIIEVSGK